MENPGIDPGISHMQSERSTIWANPPWFQNEFAMVSKERGEMMKGIVPDIQEENDKFLRLGTFVKRTIYILKSDNVSALQ